MDTNAKIQHWDKMYEMPLENIPWEIKEPPRELVDALNAGNVRGIKALDIACGTGNYTFYLAQHGFSDVLGVDFSEKALAIARKHNEELGLPVRFAFADITKIEETLKGEKFDFILDYSILHHLEPSVTASYARQCTNLLNPGGRLLLVCYSDKDEFSSGSNSATGTYGNTMFYRTTDEIRAAYKGLEEIYYKEAALGKRLHHIAHCFLFEKV